MKRVYVLGGGISGLTAAWSLAKNNTGNINKIVLLESGPRLGGWVWSNRTTNGSVHELGPRSMRFRYKAGKMALAMMSDLGLESKIIPIGPGHNAANRRLIYTREHGLVDLPSSVRGLLWPCPPFSNQLTWSIMKEPFVRPKNETTDESIHDFIVRRFGNEVADWLIDPMCRGIFAGSSKKLSVQSCFGILSDYERNHGSVIKGGLLSKSESSGVDDNPLVQRGVKERWQIYALQGGLETLIESLAGAVERVGVEVRLNTPVEHITFEGNKAKITTSSEEGILADHVISTLPANAIASVLPESCTELSYSLSSIPSVTVAVVNLEYRGRVLPDKYREAFGYLVPSHQKSDILGVVFDSSTFPELDAKDNPCTRLTIMMGGHWFEELFGSADIVSESSLVQAALQSLHNQTGMPQVDPIYCTVNVLRDCIPQYITGHSNTIEKLDDIIRRDGLPLTLLGSSYRGVSVNDCIMNSLNVSIS